MKVVFIHHHLRQGGVTKVITEQVGSLMRDHRVLVICGEPPTQAFPFPVRIVPALSYDRDRRGREDPERAAWTIRKTVHSVWKEGADIYHIHNPTLGKNRDFIRIIDLLIADGVRVLLQIHDFAEDGRPQNYSGEDYPKNCHYAVINSRDYEILRQSGLKDDGLHLIPNSVKPLPVQTTEEKKDLVLYPIRAIRRKNIGEAILLSLFLRRDEKIGITLEPTGALDVRSYRDWRAFVKEERLRVFFRLGIVENFEAVLGRARCIITTSIKEVFGLAFLEAWMGGKMLFGRLLPDICVDFIAKGLKLGHLYRMIAIPLTLFDAHLFFQKWERCFRERMKRYGIEVPSGEIEEYFQNLREAGNVDFGMLSEDLQRQVILRVASSVKDRKDILDLNPALEAITEFSESDPIVAHNREIVAHEYSVDKNRERLLDIYAKVSQIIPLQQIDREMLLKLFNAPQKNHLLLCDTAYE